MVETPNFSKTFNRNILQVAKFGVPIAFTVFELLNIFLAAG